MPEWVGLILGRGVGTSGVSTVEGDVEIDAGRKVNGEGDDRVVGYSIQLYESFV